MMAAVRHVQGGATGDLGAEWPLPRVLSAAVQTGVEPICHDGRQPTRMSLRAVELVGSGGRHSARVMTHVRVEVAEEADV